MTTVYKILGQSAPVATTNTTLYTVPSDTNSVVSTITVCNRSTTASSFRIAVIPNGETLADKNYIAYDAAAPGSDFIGMTLGLTLSSGDVVSVYSATADLSFNIFGTEISV